MRYQAGTQSSAPRFLPQAAGKADNLTHKFKACSDFWHFRPKSERQAALRDIQERRRLIQNVPHFLRVLEHAGSATLGDQPLAMTLLTASAVWSFSWFDTVKNPCTSPNPTDSLSGKALAALGVNPTSRGT
jgi:hypothetical protein